MGVGEAVDGSGHEIEVHTAEEAAYRLGVVRQRALRSGSQRMRLAEG